MPDDLYERDVLLWSERETALLHRLAAGERVNDSVDWAHVIEELADVGRAELHAVESLLAQALFHFIKLHAVPDADPARHWRTEVISFLNNARRRHAPSMRQRVDLPGLWQDAVEQAREAYHSLTLPESCPWTPDELLAERRDVAALAARLA